MKVFINSGVEIATIWLNNTKDEDFYNVYKDVDCYYG